MIEGDGGGKWYVVIENQKMELFEGEAEKHIVKMTFSDLASFLKLAKGEVNGLQAFTMGLVKPEGPRAALEKLGQMTGTY